MAIPSTIPDEVDVIVVGGPSLVRVKLIPGGAAGCVVADRLVKADPKLQILFIEA
jgi:choline dehydrogenase-like flavoprotein